MEHILRLCKALLVFLCVLKVTTWHDTETARNEKEGKMEIAVVSEALIGGWGGLIRIKTEIFSPFLICFGNGWGDSRH